MDAVEGAMRPTWRNPLRRTVTLVILLAIVLLIFLTFNRTPIPIRIETPHRFAVVFDAGSTGTRIHVFEFTKDEGNSLSLTKEHFYETKPGLSSYVDNVGKAEESVKGLLQSAIDVIPEFKRKNTPVILKATAGLRLLPVKKSRLILKQIKQTLDNSPFKTDGPGTVAIMDGDDEGLYGWETVNYLLGNFKQPVSRKLYGIVDMGGGSFQVTYALPDLESPDGLAPGSSVKSVQFWGRQFQLYDHSYLGLGLMSTRAAILNQTFDRLLAPKKIKVVNPCFPRGFSKPWKFNGVEFIISGSDHCSFDSCREVVKRVIARVARPKAIDKSEVFLLSYFFDRAVEAGLLDAKSGGVLHVEDYIDSAQIICQRGNINSSPFFCLDMTYLSTLLTDGFGFGLHKKLLLRNKINGFEVSWALGVALSLYN